MSWMNILNGLVDQTYKIRDEDIRSNVLMILRKMNENRKELAERTKNGSQQHVINELYDTLMKQKEVAEEMILMGLLKG